MVEPNVAHAAPTMLAEGGLGFRIEEVERCRVDDQPQALAPRGLRPRIEAGGADHLFVAALLHVEVVVDESDATQARELLDSQADEASE